MTGDTRHTDVAGAAFSYRRIWWLATGVLGIQLVFAAYNAFLPLLYREFLDSRAAIGLLMGTDNLIGLLLIPVVGAWSDRVTSPHGRRLPFIVVGIPVAALTFAGIPLAAVALWTLIVTEVTFTAAMHLYRGPMVALVLDHTPPGRRSTASGITQFLGGVGVLISFAVLSILYDVDPRLTFGAGAAVLLASLAAVWAAADRTPPYVDTTTATAAHPLADTLAGIRRLARPEERGTLLALAAMLVAYSAIAGLQAMFPIYGVDVLGLTEGRAARMLTAFAAALLVSALAAGALGTRFGTIATMRVGLGALPVLFVAATWIRDPGTLVVVVALVGVAWALFAIPAIALAADLGGRRRTGFYVGLYYLFIMTGQMVGPVVLGTTMDLLGDPGMWVAAAVLIVGAGGSLRAARRHLDAGSPTVAPGDVTRR